MVKVGGQLEGPFVVQDINLLETLSHLTHERIPERVVHAKGAGAYGFLEVLDDISDLTMADFLKQVGKKTKLFARFSTVVGERGSAESVRDSRGFAFKLYTEQGNLDWLFFSTPTFPIRDGGKFPSFTHSQKREPQTGLRSATTFWDFMSSNPETFNTLMLNFSDYGTPKSYRHSCIYSVNTYKFVTPSSYRYVKIHMLPDQGIQNYTQKEAEALAGADPDAFTRDLFNSIRSRKYPSWTVYAQVVEPKDVDYFSVNIFDPTRRWPTEGPLRKAAPLRRFARITLNENVQDAFGEIEQASFTPAAIVPGWDVSADPILQARLFTYGSAARYRLTINFHQLEVNKPLYARNPTKRDGILYVNHLGLQRNYIDQDGGTPPIPNDADAWTGKVQGFESSIDQSDFVQPKELWKSFLRDPPMAQHFICNVASNLCMAIKCVRERTYDVFGEIDPDLRKDIEEATEKLVPHEHPDRGLCPPNTAGIGF
jgi:catalase